MRGKNHSFNGYTFNHLEQTTNRTTNGYALYLKNVFFDRPLTNNYKSLEQWHGVVAENSYLKEITITLEGTIITVPTTTKTVRNNRGTAIKLLESIFSTPLVPSKTNRGFYDFSYIDDDGNEKTLSAKVARSLDYSEPYVARTDNDVIHTDFTVSLLVENPFKTTKVNNIAYLNEGSLVGHSIPFEYPFSYVGGTPTKIVNNGELADTVIAIECTSGTSKNPAIVNLSGDYITYAQVETTLYAGDIMELDGRNLKVYINGTEFTSGLKIGSKWVQLANGDNSLLLIDDDDMAVPNIKATVNWYITEKI